MKVIFLSFVLGLSSILISQPAKGASHLALDFFVSRFSLITDETSLRSRLTFLLGNESFSLGPLLRYDPQHSYLKDFSMGINTSWRLGRDVFLENDVSWLRRKFSGYYQNGFVLGALVAWQVGPVFRLSLPFTFKRLSQGEKRSTLDYIPHLGVRWVF